MWQLTWRERKKACHVATYETVMCRTVYMCVCVRVCVCLHVCACVCD